MLAPSRTGTPAAFEWLWLQDFFLSSSTADCFAAPVSTLCRKRCWNAIAHQALRVCMCERHRMLLSWENRELAMEQTRSMQLFHFVKQSCFVAESRWTSV